MERKLHVLTLDPYEQGLLVKGLNQFRNECIREGKSPDAVEDLILKAINAPPQKKRRWFHEDR